MLSQETIKVDVETYDLVAQSIAFIQQHPQPNLATIAQHVNLSEYQLQQLFTQWAGVNPQRFLQYLTLAHSKARIAKTPNLQVQTDRVSFAKHALFVTLEAMSPDEYRAGLQIRYGIHDTLFGSCMIALTPRGVCNIHFIDAVNGEKALLLLQQEWSQARITHDQNATEKVCDQIFHTSESAPLVLHLKGTDFQLQVWQALMRIPFGGLTTYQALAQAIDKPKAARAIGNAVGRNPIAYLIPCHRVIRGSGEMGGYRWGCARKAALLGWEASQIGDLDVEQTLIAKGARLLLVETSGKPDFDPTRTFYRSCGYEEEARIREFYAAGDDKIVFRKVLQTPG